MGTIYRQSELDNYQSHGRDGEEISSENDLDFEPDPEENEPEGGGGDQFGDFGGLGQGETPEGPGDKLPPGVELLTVPGHPDIQIPVGPGTPLAQSLPSSHAQAGHFGLAQSTPGATAIVGPGGIAIAIPQAQAIVGMGGTAISAPTSMGTAGTGGIAISGNKETKNVIYFPIY